MRGTRGLVTVVGCLWMTGCMRPVHDEAHPHWTYEGHEGPAEWGVLASDYRTCSTGQHQSPVDIDTAHAEPAALPALVIHYAATPTREVNNGHTIEDQVPPGDFLEFGDLRFELAQFHFHHPSEHTLDGRHFPLEIHFVHRGKAGAILVVAVLVAEGAEHPLFHTLFDHPPREHQAMKLLADPAALLPADRRYVEYSGSLTTPPCTEGVTWLVMSSPIFASAAQLQRFAELFPHNNRPPMPLNGRPVLSSSGR